MIFGGAKLKVAGGILIASLAAVSWLWWTNSSLRDDVSSLEKERSQLNTALSTTRNSVEVLQAQIRNLDEIAQKRQQQRRETQSRYEDLQESFVNLQDESDELLQQCLNVDLGDYAQDLQNASQRNSQNVEGGENDEQ